jgi:hypothetical protein
MTPKGDCEKVSLPVSVVARVGANGRGMCKKRSRGAVWTCLSRVGGGNRRSARKGGAGSSFQLGSKKI